METNAEKNEKTGETPAETEVRTVQLIGSITQSQKHLIFPLEMTTIETNRELNAEVDEVPLISSKAADDAVIEVCDEAVELRQRKSASLRLKIRSSVRESFKLVRNIRPKSESSVLSRNSIGARPGAFLTALYARRLEEVINVRQNKIEDVHDELEHAEEITEVPPAPLLVEDPPSTDDEALNERPSNISALTVEPVMENHLKQKDKDRKCVKISENVDNDDDDCEKDLLSNITSVSDEDRLHLFSAFRRRLSLPVQKMRYSLRIDRSNSLIVTPRSSGNFASAGPRSAPATPQGQLAAPQGLPEPLASPIIQRSPSHSVFSKADKTNLKHLSTSTPTMTAQGHLAEPPSPKVTKDPKVRTTSKARQKKFLRHFPNVEEDEKVLNHYSCALIGDILLQGHLYITKNYFAFYSNVFGYVTKLLIPVLTVEEITKEKTAKIIPNAVGIATGDDKHIFGSLMSRDSTLAYMRTVWEKAKLEEAIPEPDVTEPDQDSSESAESGRESPALEQIPSGSETLSTPTFATMRKESVRSQPDGVLLERKGSRGFVRTLKDAITEFRKLPRQSLILVATTLLLILLFLSAAVLLYRINKIQNKYSFTLQDASLKTASEDIYSDILHWQSQLHSKSASAVNNFLDNNLDQIAKVRQSLEALSTLLISKPEDAQKKSDPARGNTISTS